MDDEQAVFEQLTLNDGEFIATALCRNFQIYDVQITGKASQKVESSQFHSTSQTKLSLRFSSSPIVEIAKQLY